MLLYGHLLHILKKVYLYYNNNLFKNNGPKAYEEINTDIYNNKEEIINKELNNDFPHNSIYLYLFLHKL